MALSERRLEAISVGLLFYIPLTILILLIFLVKFLATSGLWLVIVIYLGWMYVDRGTPLAQGRSVNFVRKNPLWQNFRSYFPQTLVKTADLDPNDNYILALFPHGIFSTSAFCHFFSETSDFFKLYPGINVTPVTLMLNFYFPILRELFLASGACSCDKESIMYRLTKPGGEAVLLVPGGAAEALLTVKGAYRLVLKNRKGFIKLAHQSGASIVPVFAFGETSAYTHVNFAKESLAFRFQQSIRRITGVAPCLAWGRSIFWSAFGILPHRTPVVTVVGKPMVLKKIDDPSDDVVDESHEHFVRELNNLFETYKHKYIPNPEMTHLIFED